MQNAIVKRNVKQRGRNLLHAQGEEDADEQEEAEFYQQQLL